MVVLVVEDNDIKYQIIESILQSFKVELLREKCLMEALKNLSQNNYDGIITDLGLPRCITAEGVEEDYDLYQGLEICRFANKKHPDIKILINSTTDIPLELKKNIKFHYKINGINDLNVIKEFIMLCDKK